MEGDRKIQIIIAIIAGVLLAFAYGVGYYVGKGTGIEEEKRICEIQKKQLIKTLSRITPVSRPQPVEEKVVGAPSEKETPQKSVETAESETTKEATTPLNVTSPSQPQQRAEAQAEKATSKKPSVAEQSQISKPFPEVTAKAEKKGEAEKRVKTVSSVKRKESSGKRYYLQVGIFRNKSNAIKLAQRLNEKGFQSKTVFGGKYVKVVVGYFDSLHQARVVQKELRSAGFDSVLKWRGN